MEELEKAECTLPLIFAELFKDEINANDEHRIFNGIKRVIKKYAEDENSMSVINEFFRVMTGGTSILEILQISIDETLNPTSASDITVSNKCDLH